MNVGDLRHAIADAPDNTFLNITTSIKPAEVTSIFPVSAVFDRSNAEVIGVLRFRGETTFEQRQEALELWRKQHRPRGREELHQDEALWLDKIAVHEVVPATSMEDLPEGSG